MGRNPISFLSLVLEIVLELQNVSIHNTEHFCVHLIGAYLMLNHIICENTKANTGKLEMGLLTVSSAIAFVWS